MGNNRRSENSAEKECRIVIIFIDKRPEQDRRLQECWKLRSFYNSVLFCLANEERHKGKSNHKGHGEHEGNKDNGGEAENEFIWMYYCFSTY